MGIIKKFAIVIAIAIVCMLIVMPQKVNAIDMTGIMDGAENFINSAEDRELFNKDKEKERHRSSIFYYANNRDCASNFGRFSSWNSVYNIWCYRTS